MYQWHDTWERWNSPRWPQKVGFFLSQDRTEFEGQQMLPMSGQFQWSIAVKRAPNEFKTGYMSELALNAVISPSSVIRYNSMRSAYIFCRVYLRVWIHDLNDFPAMWSIGVLEHLASCRMMLAVLQAPPVDASVALVPCPINSARNLTHLHERFHGWPLGDISNRCWPLFETEECLLLFSISTNIY